jgi:MFS family permease
VPFLAVEAATALSATANGIASVVLPWLVLERTGSAAATGLVAALTALPMFFASFLSGTVVDRVGRRPTSVASDLLSAASVAALPVVDLVVGLDLWWICALALLGAVFDPAGVTAREAMLPAAAAAGNLRLERVNGIHEAVWGTAFIVGPGLAGVAIGFVGAVTTLWVTAVAFVASAVVIGLVRVPGAGRPEPAEHSARTGFWADTRVGLDFFRRDAVLVSVGVFGTLLTATYMPIEGVLLPVYFTEQDAPARLGMLLMVMSVGWVAGSLTYSAIGHRFPRRTVFVVASIGTAVALVPLAFLPAFPIMLAAGALAGFLYGPLGPLINLAMQTRTPEHLRGRVTGLLTSFATAAAPAGYLLAGPLVQWVGLQPAFFVMVGLVIVTGVTTAFLRPLEALNEAVLPVEPIQPGEPIRVDVQTEHGGHLPASSMPAPAMPGTALPGTALPGTALPGTALPGTALPGTGRPDDRSTGGSGPQDHLSGALPALEKPVGGGGLG